MPVPHDVSLPFENLKQRLIAELSQYPRLIVAYSGGVDSAYLAYEAFQLLGDKMTAVLADSPSLARSHFESAVDFANTHRIPLKIIQTQEMTRSEYTRNDSSRCFHCKDELFAHMELFVQAEGSEATLAYGRNLDDAGDFRPGQKAAQAHNVVAPLAEAGLGKEAIRALAKAAGIHLWDKPASACLASRIEYGRPVTTEALRSVEEAESALLALGFRQCRVRHHGPLARVEIEVSELENALTLAMLSQITQAVRAAGFTYVTLDCEGYRSGSMNHVLPISAIQSARHAS